jgi:peroxiredoxin
MKNKHNPVIKHKHHKISLIDGPFGPHVAKIICVSCNNTFVKWASKLELKVYKSMIDK